MLIFEAKLFIFIFDNTFSVYFSLRDDAFFGVFFLFNCLWENTLILLSNFQLYACMQMWIVMGRSDASIFFVFVIFLLIS